MQFDEFGYLTVRTTSASNALPIEGSIIHVSGAVEENRFIEYSVITDVDGITEKLRLPCPSSIYSLTPGPQEIPYGLYNVEVSAKGFLTKNIYNVAIFSQINTVLPVNMIPASTHNTQNEIPRDNLNTVVSENPMLE